MKNEVVDGITITDADNDDDMGKKVVSRMSYILFRVYGVHQRKTSRDFRTRRHDHDGDAQSCPPPSRVGVLVRSNVRVNLSRGGLRRCGGWRGSTGGELVDCVRLSVYILWGSLPVFFPPYV